MPPKGQNPPGDVHKHGVDTATTRLIGIFQADLAILQLYCHSPANKLTGAHSRAGVELSFGLRVSHSEF